MRGKFGNKPCVCDGFNFQSQLERDFYLSCKAWKQQGKICDFEMQVVYPLHAGIKYKLDFKIKMNKIFYQGQLYSESYIPVELMCSRYVEVKGHWTAVAKLKRKLFEADYGPLEIHTAKVPWKP